MANRGDYYTIVLKRSHLEWGVYRHTHTRDLIYGEGYLKIPSEIAYNFNILNTNGTRGQDIFGLNLFNCKSVDGYFDGVLRAQGNQNDSIFAKQFSGDGNLKSIGLWFQFINANIGDIIEIKWISSVDIIIRKL